MGKLHRGVLYEVDSVIGDERGYCYAANPCLEGVQRRFRVSGAPPQSGTFAERMQFGTVKRGGYTIQSAV